MDRFEPGEHVDIHWLSLQQAAEQLPTGLFSHLADDSSLTRRVRSRCEHGFEVHLISHETARPNRLERRLLGLEDADQALARQVFLCCDGQARIFARTIIGLVDKNLPLTQRISSLGEQSLGSILFQDPLARKIQMQLAVLPAGHAFFQGVSLGVEVADAGVWVRRSLYDYQGCELIVYEAFIDFPE